MLSIGFHSYHKSGGGGGGRRLLLQWKQQQHQERKYGTNPTRAVFEKHSLPKTSSRNRIVMVQKRSYHPPCRTTTSIRSPTNNVVFLSQFQQYPKRKISSSSSSSSSVISAFRRYRLQNQHVQRLERLEKQKNLKTTKLKDGGKQQQQEKKRTMKDVARFLFKVIRIPTLVLGVYGIGHQQGIIDCTRSPIATQMTIMDRILIDYGTNVKDLQLGTTVAATKKTKGQQQQQQQQQDDDDQQVYYDENGYKIKKKKVIMFNKETITENDLNLHKAIVNVGDDILRAAILYVKEQLEEAIEEADYDIRAKTDDAKEIKTYIGNDEKVEFWKDALVRLQGEASIALTSHNDNQRISKSITEKVKGIIDSDYENERNNLINNRNNKDATGWSYIFIESENPNAFVTELLPKKIFITSGLFDLNLVNNIDELAMVLGHEISHLILGHISETYNLDLVVRTIELFIYSIDFTEGLLSLLLMSLLGTLSKKWIYAQQSQDNELSADELGIILTARACYNTQRGIQVMKNFHTCLENNHNPSSAEVETETTTSSKDTTDTTTTTNISLTDSLLNMMSTHPPSIERYEKLKVLSKVENEHKYSNSTCKHYIHEHIHGHRKQDGSNTSSWWRKWI